MLKGEIVMDEHLNDLNSRTEQAKELGIKHPEKVDWGNMSSKVCGSVGGAVGGNFTRNAVQTIEEQLVNKK